MFEPINWPDWKIFSFSTSGQGRKNSWLRMIQRIQLCSYVTYDSGCWHGCTLVKLQCFPDRQQKVHFKYFASCFGLKLKIRLRGTKITLSRCHINDGCSSFHPLIIINTTLSCTKRHCLWLGNGSRFRGRACRNSLYQSDSGQSVVVCRVSGRQWGKCQINS